MVEYDEVGDHAQNRALVAFDRKASQSDDGNVGPVHDVPGGHDRNDPHEVQSLHEVLDGLVVLDDRDDLCPIEHRQGFGSTSEIADVNYDVDRSTLSGLL